MSKAAKALILTWLIIGFLIAGGIGFYLGRTTAPKSQIQNTPGTGGQQQPLRSATPSAAPSNPGPGGQQPAGGGQPSPQK